jgi:glycosyltransferase involved in cell wall biosynthesis/ubiquinone/menaquinone biosynthesis C-methylase UbiE
MRALYLAPALRLAVVDEPRLDATTERHGLDLVTMPYEPQAPALDALGRDASLQGLVIEMDRGYAGRSHLRLAARALALGRRVWLYWPGERTVECLDRDRLGGFRRLWAMATLHKAGLAAGAAARAIPAALAGTGRGMKAAAGNAISLARIVRSEGMRAGGRAVGSRLSGQPPAPVRAAQRRAALDASVAAASPVGMVVAPDPSPAHPVHGCGVYLRTDWWVKIESGGSYGHTCYVAKELAAVSTDFICFMAQRYKLLDTWGLRQIVLEPRSATATEDDIASATEHYYRILKPAFEALRPAFIYERLVLGNYVGARLSLELGIPYIVEYNGSEISMRRSFEGVGYIYEDEYLKAETFAFRQATIISVISAEVKADLVARGVDPGKILVNPNGADPEVYAPAAPEEQRAIRVSAGLDPDEPVVGFTGTFGGWHGVDVLAEALPDICARAPEAQFLLIGDGHFKYLVDAAVAKHELQRRVRKVGRVPQAEGARLLKACDIFVSPHHKHMVDSRFFGSPTKVFEYMAVGGGIVASDLEQIGESLSPGLRVEDLRRSDLVVTNQRAVLCTPGDVREFADAVVELLKRPAVRTAIGRNARTAVLEQFSWNRHVAHLWPFIARQSIVRPPAAAPDPRGRLGPPTVPASAPGPPVATGDRFKDEVQRQWDNDPAGSHYVERAAPHTLEWFLEAEAYRYGDYAPWMPRTMEFAAHAGEDVLEIGGGMGTDLAQFALNGARVTDLDLSAGHLELAKENFRLRGLEGTFVHHDAETLPFPDNRFDVVYSNGVLHHTPNTRAAVGEIRRVLRPGGQAIVMVYAENSLIYWRNLVWAIGLQEGRLSHASMGEIMSWAVERSDNAGARPLVKVYTRRRLAALFDGFTDVRIEQQQLIPGEVPRILARVPRRWLARLLGWNLVIKARKPRA